MYTGSAPWEVWAYSLSMGSACVGRAYMGSVDLCMGSAQGRRNVFRRGGGQRTNYKA